MNGETAHGDEEEKESEGPTEAPAPSLTKSQMFEGVARVHGSPVELKQDNNGIEINIKKPNSVPQELTVRTKLFFPLWDNSIVKESALKNKQVFRTTISLAGGVRARAALTGHHHPSGVNNRS